MKTTVDLPDALIREVKLRAVMQRRTIKDLIADYIRHGLGMTPSPGHPAAAVEPPASDRVIMGENGLPVIRCAPHDAPATRMTIKELVALEQEALSEEDLQRAGLPL